VTRFLFWLDRVGSIGALVAAVMAPCCLPIFAAFAGAAGITALAFNEAAVFYVLQAFALLAIAGLALTASRHKQFGPLILGAIALLTLFFSFHARFSALLIYFGLGGLCVASVWNYLLSRKRRDDGAGVILQSVITCPKCGRRAEEAMPTNACLVVYECSRCGATL
jgi:hypothetical protein